jgi:hypothetical protein
MLPEEKKKSFAAAETKLCHDTLSFADVATREDDHSDRPWTERSKAKVAATCNKLHTK